MLDLTSARKAWLKAWTVLVSTSISYKILFSICLTSTIKNTNRSAVELSGILFKEFIICTRSFLYSSENLSTSLKERD